ncbi:hypothetical protein GCM10020295_44100 [Streptomyces cinereospinus]
MVKTRRQDPITVYGCRSTPFLTGRSPDSRSSASASAPCRRAAGLSQVQLGDLVGRDHKTIHRYETAQTSPNLLDLILIAHAVGVPLAELTG